MSITTTNALRAIENEFFRNFNYPSVATDKEGFVPAINSLEEDSSYKLDVDLPGVAKESIKIDVKDRELTISGERSLCEEHKKEDYFKFESSFGSFVRRFTLPENADTENITASSENGVLSLSIPKVEEVDNHYTISID